MHFSWHWICGVHVANGSEASYVVQWTKINPALITHWNHIKDTREKANHQAGYRHLSVVSRFINTLIMEVTLNASKIFKWVQLENELDRIESTDSLKRQFHRTALSTVLKQISAIFRRWVLKPYIYQKKRYWSALYLGNKRCTCVRFAV